jgi:hypothetical protein
MVIGSEVGSSDSARSLFWPPRGRRAQTAFRREESCRGVGTAIGLKGDSHATAPASLLAEPRGKGLGLTYRGTHAACPHYRFRKP